MEVWKRRNAVGSRAYFSSFPKLSRVFFLTNQSEMDSHIHVQSVGIYAGYQNKLLGAVAQVDYTRDFVTRPAAMQATIHVTQ